MRLANNLTPSRGLRERLEAEAKEKEMAERKARLRALLRKAEGKGEDKTT